MSETITPAAITLDLTSRFRANPSGELRQLLKQESYPGNQYVTLDATASYEKDDNVVAALGSAEPINKQSDYVFVGFGVVADAAGDPLSSGITLMGPNITGGSGSVSFASYVVCGSPSTLTAILGGYVFVGADQKAYPFVKQIEVTIG